jgi:predicted GIY-YIG superfamily endonuclease
MTRIKPVRHLKGPEPKKVGEQKTRTHSKYQFKEGNKIVHGGITNDLERREKEHQRKWPKGHIKQVGRRTTEEAARKWEKDKGYS